MTPIEKANFEIFYQHYLREHSRPLTRALHIVGLIVFIEGVGRAIFISPWWLLWAVGGGYAIGWFSHFVVEKNVPTTFGKPLWSIKAGRRMYKEILTGKLPLWSKI